MIKSLLGTITLISVLLAGTSMAEAGNAAKHNSEKFENLESIPPVLLSRLQGARYEEQYVAEILSVIYQNGGDDMVLNSEDIERATQKEMVDARRQQASMLIQYDINFDGQTDRQEIEESYKLLNKGMSGEAFSDRYAKNISSLMERDLNADGVITYVEMATLKEGDKRARQRQRVGQLSDYMTCDENKDGNLTVDEVRTAAKKAFATIDADGNGVVSDEERASAQRPLQTQREMSKFDKCAFKNLDMPANLAVYGAGAYAGKRLGRQIDDSGHDATSMKIVVNETKKPVALVLGAYEPTIWSVQLTKGTKVHAVMLSGYHQQIIAGLPSETPILVSTYDNRNQNSGCGYVYFSEENVKKLNPLSRQLFGKPADMFYPAKDGVAVIGDANYNPSDLTDAPVDPVAFAKVPDVPAGQRGLDDAIQKGIIRLATPSDSDAWLDALEKSNTNKTEMDIPPVAGKTARDYLPKIQGGPAYVVLKDFVYPAGLFGGHSVVFIIPKGVKRPSGDPGHSAVYDMNDMSCGGARAYSSETSWCSISARK